MIGDSPEQRPARVLIVDDVKINRDVLKGYLHKEGHEPLEAVDGTSALKLIESDSEIDLVLLDIMMPDIGGIEVCRRIRQDMGNLTIPIIFVTALGDRQSRIEGKDVGGDDFLTKPIDRLELVVRVKNLLKVKVYHDLRKRQNDLVAVELERAKKQLLRADRLASLGTLAGGVGHELNNILSVLCGTMEFVKENAKMGKPPQANDIEQLSLVTQHLKTHANQLLNLGRPGPDHKQVLDLRDVVKATIEMLNVAGRTKYVQVDLELPDTPVQVTVNRTRIEQVLVNLVGNAADAVLETNNGKYQIRVFLEITGDRAVCTVEDNGVGIPQDKLNSIFDSYFTTKTAGKGTGLGLPVVKQIVETYDGSVTVNSVAGQGSTFRFDLPIITPTK